MSATDSEHGLRIQLATALRELEKAHARIGKEHDALVAAESALAAARRECDLLKTLLVPLAMKDGALPESFPDDRPLYAVGFGAPITVGDVRRARKALAAPAAAAGEEK